MARQGYDLSLTRYANEGWRATFYVTGREHSATGATGSAWEPTPWRAVQGAAWEAMVASVRLRRAHRVRIVVAGDSSDHDCRLQHVQELRPQHQQVSCRVRDRRPVLDAMRGAYSVSEPLDGRLHNRRRRTQRESGVRQGTVRIELDLVVSTRVGSRS
jgi:hypothetical protein